MARARNRRRPLTARLAALLGLLLVLTACPAPPSEDGASSPSGNEETAGEPTDDGEQTSAEPDTEQLTIAVVGDSITVGSDPTFAPDQVSEDSWVRYAVGDPIELTGGWARWGATTAEMAAAVEPVPADVLVVMAGTNDLAAGTPTAQVAQNLEDIVATVGAKEVLLCAVPPLDARPEVVPPFNDFLEHTAEARGWAWVDPAVEIRSEGRFAPGMSVDGVHPTQTGATQLGIQVRNELLNGFGHSG